MRPSILPLVFYYWYFATGLLLLRPSIIVLLLIQTMRTNRTRIPLPRINIILMYSMRTNIRLS